MKKILSIAGSDNSGGAGIQADIKTILSHGMYPLTVITVITAQNQDGIYSFHKLPINIIESQIDSIFNTQNIKPDAIKIGLIGDKLIAKCIMKKLIKYNAKNIVFDPILSLSSNNNKILLNYNDIDFLKNEFIKIVNLITPNINEAKILSNINNNDFINMILELNRNFKSNVLLKGGHFNCDDYLYINNNKNLILLKGKKIETKNTHGTGCVLSTAIACNLANNKNILYSVFLAKNYLKKMLKNKYVDFQLNYGPVPHNIPII